MRVRPLAQLLHLLVLQVDPVVDEVVAEHTASGEEAPIGIQSFQGTVERCGNRGDLRKLFSRKFEQVAILAIARIDLVLDAV